MIHGQSSVYSISVSLSIWPICNKLSTIMLFTPFSFPIWSIPCQNKMWCTCKLFFTFNLVLQMYIVYWEGIIMFIQQTDHKQHMNYIFEHINEICLDVDILCLTKNCNSLLYTTLYVCICIYVSPMSNCRAILRLWLGTMVKLYVHFSFYVHCNIPWYFMEFYVCLK